MTDQHLAVLYLSCARLRNVPRSVRGQCVSGVPLFESSTVGVRVWV
jgi:hypothetical protein